MASKQVCVGCIQTNNGYIKTPQENLNSVVPFIENAVAKGVQLLLFPELMPNEYIFGTELWDFGETLLNGVTLSFMSEQSKKHHIYIGLSFLEIEGLHFYNTFIMTNPSGKLIGKIRKNPAALEAFYFNGYNNKHRLKTNDFGNIFIGICYENYLSKLENELIEYQNSNDENDKISLILQPHSSPFAQPKPGSFNADKISTINNTIDSIATQYAKKFNIPVLFCNKVGKLRSKILNEPSMGGWTKIVNHNGSLVAKSENCGQITKPVHELIVGYVDIGAHNNDNDEKFKYIKEKWNRWHKSIYDTFKMAEFVGYIYYNLSIQRRIKASKVSGHNWLPSYSLHIGWLSITLYVLHKLR